MWITYHGSHRRPGMESLEKAVLLLFLELHLWRGAGVNKSTGHSVLPVCGGCMSMVPWLGGGGLLSHGKYAD